MFVACETGAQYPETITAPTGFITSPNYPNDYPFDSDCAWTLKAPNGQVILCLNLVSSRLKLEIGFERV